jgi:hypothetical protein
MANLCGASLQAVAFRVTQLVGGAPVAGDIMYVTDNLVKIDFNPEMEAGQEITTKNAAGNICVAYRTPDTMKRLTLSVEVCVPDPELEVLLTGGDVFREGVAPDGEVMGFSYPPLLADPNPEGTSLEAWTRYVVDGAQPPSQPYMHWAFPMAKLTKGNRTIDINAMGNVYDGFAIENPNWGDGPDGSFTFPTDRVVQAMFTDQVPASQCGALAIPNQGVAATGATAGVPGLWTPSGATPPADVASIGGVVAQPVTAWTTGQYVQTGTAGSAGEGHWDGDSWEPGKAP